jgi:mRNA-degrading endonuclease YafQ of YafQ-DinJ toxin-antitoxin module
MATHRRPRPLNKYFKDHKLTCETLKHLKNLTRAGDWMVTFDLVDGYCTLGMREEDIDFFTINHRGTLYMLGGLPMGKKCSNYYF